NGICGLALFFCLPPGRLCFSPLDAGAAAYPQNLGWMSALSSAPSKQELRAAALAARDALGDKKREAAAKALARRGLPLEIARGAVVSGYSPVRNEIDPAPLMLRLAEAGARLALPVINARGKS